MNVETYARDFLRTRGYFIGSELNGDDCVRIATNVLLEESPVVLTLSDLRRMAAQAQFSERECPGFMLRFIESTGHLAGDAWVTMGKESCELVLERTKIEEREVM